MELKVGKGGELVAQTARNYENIAELRTAVAEAMVVKGFSSSLEESSFYLLYNGKLLNQNSQLEEFQSIKWATTPAISVIPRIVGGKGGFGSMLRAIGAQIEKTTNRDACRDLSGRRLRDINEERRLKKWYDKQKEREEARKEAKKTKLEKLRHFADGPSLIKIEDQEFLQKREDVEESVYEAVDQAFESGEMGFIKDGSDETSNSSIKSEESSNSGDAKPSSSTSGEASKSKTAESKQGASTSSTVIPSGQPGSSSSSHKKVKKFAFDQHLDSDDSSEDDSTSEDEVPAKKAKI